MTHPRDEHTIATAAEEQRCGHANEINRNVFSINNLSQSADGAVELAHAGAMPSRTGRTAEIDHGAVQGLRSRAAPIARAEACYRGDPATSCEAWTRRVFI